MLSTVRIMGVDCERDTAPLSLSLPLSLYCAQALSPSSAPFLRSLSLCDIQNIIPHETPGTLYTWPRIKTLLSLENKDLGFRFSPLCDSLPRRRSHPGIQGEGVRWLKEPRTEYYQYRTCHCPCFFNTTTTTFSALSSPA